MGATPADTALEIARLRSDMTAALQEVERRVRGGIRTVATAEARITSARTRDEVVNRARENPTLLGVTGVVAAGAVAYGAFALVNGLRKRNQPQYRLKRRVQSAGDELSERVTEGIEETRRQLERARQHGLLLKLDPEDGGYVRVTDARLEPLTKKRGQSTVIKKFVWAALLSVFMALGSVLARRVADNVWRAMVHEEPPTEKSRKEPS
jgi:hypothetical protein